jgi:hypothetical protein
LASYYCGQRFSQGGNRSFFQETQIYLAATGNYLREEASDERSATVNQSASLHTGLAPLSGKPRPELLAMKRRLIGIMAQGTPKRMTLGDRVLVLALVAMFFPLLPWLWSSPQAAVLPAPAASARFITDGGRVDGACLYDRSGFILKCPGFEGRISQQGRTEAWQPVEVDVIEGGG